MACKRGGGGGNLLPGSRKVRGATGEGKGPSAPRVDSILTPLALRGGEAPQ